MVPSGGIELTYQHPFCDQPLHQTAGCPAAVWRRAAQQSCRDSTTNRQLSLNFTKEELSRWIDLKEHVLPIGGQPDVEHPEAQSQRAQEIDQFALYPGRQHVRFYLSR